MNHRAKMSAMCILTAGLLSAAGSAVAGGVTADLGITKTDNVTQATIGGQVTYTITASNAGPDDVTGATVTDNFPAQLLNCSTTCASTAPNSCTAGPVAGNLNDTMVDLVNGGSVVYTAVCDIDAGATGTLSNTATITSTATDGNPANDSSTDGDTVLIVGPAPGAVSVPVNSTWMLVMMLLMIGTVTAWTLRKKSQADR